MIKLIYKPFDGGNIVEKNYETLRDAMFDANYIQKSITGQVLKIEEGERVYSYQEIMDYFKIK